MKKHSRLWVCCLLSAFPLFNGFALQDVTITVFRQWDNNAILWGGDGNTAWEVLQLERRGALVYSYVLLTAGNLYGLNIQISDNDTLQNVIDRLATNPIPDMKYVDWSGDWSGNITPYYSTGHVFIGADGKPSGVMLNNGGDLSTVALNAVGEGYQSDPFVLNGVTGTFQVRQYGDSPTGWVTTADFVPNWNGGINSDSSPTTSTGTFTPSSSNVGSSPSQSSYTFPEVPTTQQGNNLVVSIPSQTIVGSSGSYTHYDYSGILSAIGGVLQSSSIQNHNDLSTINDNLQKQLEINDAGELQVAPTDDTEYSVDFSEANESIEEVSGWGFDFGMGSNPIGNIFSRILGNPPTSFGSVDRVWDIEFDLGFTRLHSTFSLSDWFPRAFRSTVLVFVTLFFSVASVRAISGAFS